MNTIATPVSASAPIQATGGAGRLHSQAQVAGPSLAGLLASPEQYTVNVFTTDRPMGAMSGNLQAATQVFRMALLNSSAGSGAATVRLLYTGPANAMSSAEVTMEVSYEFASQVTFSGLRLYSGQAESGTIAVTAALEPGTASNTSGTGVLTAPATEVDTSVAANVQAVEGIISNPGSYAVGVDTLEHADASLTGALRSTDAMRLQIAGFTNPLTASALDLYTLRTPPARLRQRQWYST